MYLYILYRDIILLRDKESLSFGNKLWMYSYRTIFMLSTQFMPALLQLLVMRTKHTLQLLVNSRPAARDCCCSRLEFTINVAHTLRTVN